MPARPKHIGIAAVTAEGAALAYRVICAEAASLLGPRAHPEITLHSHSFADYFAPEKDRLELWSDLLLQSSGILAQAGADFFICPANTNHEVYELVCDRLPIPWLNIAEVVLDQVAKAGFSHPAVLGTKYLMQGPVYRDEARRRRMTTLIPESAEQDTIHRIIYDELVPGRIEDASRKEVLSIIGALQKRGADCALLACTELPLLIDKAELPLFDSTRLLALAALHRAVEAG